MDCYFSLWEFETNQLIRYKQYFITFTSNTIDHETIINTYYEALIILLPRKAILFIIMRFNCVFWLFQTCHVTHIWINLYSVTGMWTEKYCLRGSRLLRSTTSTCTARHVWALAHNATNTFGISFKNISLSSIRLSFTRTRHLFIGLLHLAGHSNSLLSLLFNHPPAIKPTQANLYQSWIPYMSAVTT